LNKKIAKEIRQQKRKEKEDKKAKQIVNSLNAVKRVVLRGELMPPQSILSSSG
jgi:hypothetical protein